MAQLAPPGAPPWQRQQTGTVSVYSRHQRGSTHTSRSRGGELANTRGSTRTRVRQASAELEEAEDAKEEEDPSFRNRLKHLLDHSRFDSVMGFIILANVTVMVFQTNTKVWEAKNECNGCHPGSGWQQATDYVFLGIYTVECAARIFANRTAFFYSKWNLLDFFIVAIAYVDIIVTEALSSSSGVNAPNVAILRIFRIFRLLRVVRILSFFPELYAMIRGFMGAMMAMFWGGVMIFILVLLWSILTVEAIHGLDVAFDDEYCDTAFFSVERSMLLLFQTLVAGDSWGACMIPVIRKQGLTLIIFAGALITIQLGFTNLILAVIVDRAGANSEADAAEKVAERQRNREEATERIRHAIEGIDEDQSGSICMEELLKGYDESPELKDLLSYIDVGRDDLQRLFRLLVDENGEASYHDLVENLQRCESQGLNTQVMLVSLAIQRMDKELSKGQKEEKAGWKTTKSGSNLQQPDSEAKANSSPAGQEEFASSAGPPAAAGQPAGLFAKEFATLRKELDAQATSMQSIIAESITERMRAQVAALETSNKELIAKLTRVTATPAEPRGSAPEEDGTTRPGHPEQTPAPGPPNKARLSMFSDDSDSHDEDAGHAATASAALLQGGPAGSDDSQTPAVLKKKGTQSLSKAPSKKKQTVTSKSGLPSSQPSKNSSG